MKNNRKTVRFIIWLCVTVALLVGSLVLGSPGGKQETIQETMRDAVLHGDNKISFFGMKDVNPAMISAVTLTVVLLAAAALIRIFVIPKFKNVPGKFQLLLEQAVGMFDGLAKSNSPHKNGFLGAYLFGAGSYIFIGTLFELFGFQGDQNQSDALWAVLLCLLCCAGSFSVDYSSGMVRVIAATPRGRPSSDTLAGAGPRLGAGRWVCGRLHLRFRADVDKINSWKHVSTFYYGRNIFTI